MSTGSDNANPNRKADPAAQPGPGPGASTSPEHSATRATLAGVLGEGGYRTTTFRDNVRAYVPAARLLEVMRTLKSQRGFLYLAELGGADYFKYPKGSGSGARFEVHYVLRNLDTNETLVVKVGVDDPDPTLPSVVPLWEGANWMEREVYDMYGIRFDGHPDLRRILMPDEFTSFPLRKDYPLRGRGERHNFPRLTRANS